MGEVRISFAQNEAYGGYFGGGANKKGAVNARSTVLIVQPSNKFLSRAIDGMRLCSRALVLSGLIVCAAEARADSSSSDSNSANNPVEPKLTLEYWNYYALSLNKLNGGAENGEGRVLIPFKVNGIQQVFHIDPPVVTAPARDKRTAYRPRRRTNL